MTALAAAADTVSTGEAWAFWILGGLAVIGALGMVIARNAVHSALWLVVTMLCLGFLYVVNSAPFLGAVQIIVYTGAIMMLFLFVLMLVGRDASDSLIETLRGQRVAAILLGVGFAVLVATGLARSLGDGDVGRPDRGQRRTATSRASPRCCSPSTSSRSRSPRRCSSRRRSARW